MLVFSKFQIVASSELVHVCVSTRVDKNANIWFLEQYQSAVNTITIWNGNVPEYIIHIYVYLLSKLDYMVLARSSYIRIQHKKTPVINLKLYISLILQQPQRHHPPPEISQLQLFVLGCAICQVAGSTRLQRRRRRPYKSAQFIQMLSKISIHFIHIREALLQHNWMYSRAMINASVYHIHRQNLF